MPLTAVEVETNPPYRVLVGAGALDALRADPAGGVAVLADAAVWALHPIPAHSDTPRHEQPGGEGVKDDVDDVVTPNAFAEKLPLRGVQKEMHRGVVLHQPGHDTRGVEYRHQVGAGWVMNEGVVLHVMRIVGNELAV